MTFLVGNVLGWVGPVDLIVSQVPWIGVFGIGDSGTRLDNISLIMMMIVDNETFYLKWSKKKEFIKKSWPNPDKTWTTSELKLKFKIHGSFWLRQEP